MIYGPKLNNSSKFHEINGEDQLGIKYVAINMSDTLQNGITSITPRARYWSFYTWVLYDFIKNPTFEKSVENLRNFMKKQEWYFILSNIAYMEKTGKAITSLQGVTLGKQVWEDDKQKDIRVYQDYIQNYFGGYNVYRAVLKQTGLTYDPDPENGIIIDRITKTGERVAQAFESAIRETRYYKEYRLYDKPVPRDVLVEYGDKTHLTEIGDTPDGKILLDVFMPQNINDEYGQRRRSSLGFYVSVLKGLSVTEMADNEWRDILLDKFSSRVNPLLALSDQVREVAIGWEICVTRMFFTFALEGIFSRVLCLMSRSTIGMKKLIDDVLSDIDSKILVKKLFDYIGDKVLSQGKRDEAVKHLRDHDDQAVLSGLRLAADVYLRIADRTDFDDFHKELLSLGGIDQISLQSWIDTVEKNKETTVYQFLQNILQRFIIEQHLKTAVEKLYSTNNQTFHFVYEEGLLHYCEDDTPSFNVMRIVQANMLIKDLGLI